MCIKCLSPVISVLLLKDSNHLTGSAPWRHNPDVNFHPSYRLVKRICQAIVDHPAEDKYRRIKITSNTFKKVECPGMIDFLKAIGFVVDEDFLYYVDTSEDNSHTNLMIGVKHLEEIPEIRRAEQQRQYNMTTGAAAKEHAAMKKKFAEAIHNHQRERATQVVQASIDVLSHKPKFQGGDAINRLDLSNQGGS